MSDTSIISLDVARLAGVRPMTVSRLPPDVSAMKNTMERVRKVARDLMVTKFSKVPLAQTESTASVATRERTVETPPTVRGSSRTPKGWTNK